MDEGIDESQRILITQRRKAKQIGHILWIVIITIGILGWIFHKWYMFPISIGFAFLAGSIYSYLATKRIETNTGLSIQGQETILMNKPMRESKKNFGFRHNNKGELVFDFTDEEQAKAEETFRKFQDYKVHPDYAEELQKMLTCLSLVDLGNDYMFQVDLIEVKDEIEQSKEKVSSLLEHAMVEYSKAFSIYSIKTILFSVANVFIKKNDFVRAKESLQKYVSHIQPVHYSNKVVNLFLQWHLELLGYDSLQKLDVVVKEQISQLCL